MVRLIGLLGIAVVVTIVAFVPRSHGIFGLPIGAGDLVFDPSSYVESIAQTVHQANMVGNQIRQIEFTIRNLESSFSIRQLLFSWNRLVPIINFYAREFGFPYRVQTVRVYYPSVYGIPRLPFPGFEVHIYRPDHHAYRHQERFQDLC